MLLHSPCPHSGFPSGCLLLLLFAFTSLTEFFLSYPHDIASFSVFYRSEIIQTTRAKVKSR